ncbi:MAG: hypothetical protein WCP12_17485 [bacterium]
MGQWIKYGILAVVVVVFVRFGSWPIDKQPAPSLSLASAWMCEKFANGMGIEVERNGLKIVAVNPSYNQYRLAFVEDGAWQIRGTISALIILMSFIFLTGRFSGIGILASLTMIVFFHIVRLMLLAILPIMGSFDFVDNATRVGYILCTSLSMLSVLNSTSVRKKGKLKNAPLVPEEKLPTLNV